jgi:hypothetical protein
LGQSCRRADGQGHRRFVSPKNEVTAPENKE